MSEFEPIGAGVRSREQPCKKCGNSYEAHYIVLFTKPRDLSGGLCPDCRMKLRAEYDEKEEMKRKAALAHKRREWRENCGIPPAFMDKEFGNFEVDKQTTAYKKALEYADHYPIGHGEGYQSLVLYSDNAWGVGKTHLACAIIHHILNKWDGEVMVMPCFFTTEPDLFRSIQATYNYSMDERAIRETEEDIYNRLIRVPLLVIDDIGKEQRSDPRFVQRVLFAVIDGRYAKNLPLVLTSNLSPEQLEKHLGGVGSNEASFDRLVQMTNGKFVRMKGASYRRER